MKKTYIQPTTEVIDFGTDDLLTTGVPITASTYDGLATDSKSTAVDFEDDEDEDIEDDTNIFPHW